MLPPLIGTPYRYIHVGKAKHLPANLLQSNFLFSYCLHRGIGELVTTDSAVAYYAYVTKISSCILLEKNYIYLSKAKVL